MLHYTLSEANAILPLVKTIARELAERRGERQRVMRLREELEAAVTPEGLGEALAEADGELQGHTDAMRRAREELEGLGLSVLRVNPLTVHFPGRAPSSVVFCWMEGDDVIGHGHPVGEEEEPRRPLQVRAGTAPPSAARPEA